MTAVVHPRPLSVRFRPLAGMAVAWAVVAGRVRRSPGTFILLTVITITSLVLDLSAEQAARTVLHHVSSNLAHIEQLRFGTLVASAFWLEDSTEIVPWTLLFFLVVAPAEAWLGTGRWLLVFAAGHIGATLATLGGLWLAIDFGIASRHLAHSVDVGVSYGFFAVAAVLVYRLPARWRLWYVAAVLIYPVWSTVANRGFTDFGHLAALAIGFSLYPLTRPRTRTPLEGAAQATD